MLNDIFLEQMEILKQHTPKSPQKQIGPVADEKDKYINLSAQEAEELITGAIETVVSAAKEKFPQESERKGLFKSLGVFIYEMTDVSYYMLRTTVRIFEESKKIFAESEQTAKSISDAYMPFVYAISRDLDKAYNRVVERKKCADNWHKKTEKN